ncbi:hypothetical protein PBOI14_53950 [Pseudomonas sp. Boi14]|nr:hypothetical protein PBOI14_53950 [Pseudomonas sp. Boi14]
MKPELRIGVIDSGHAAISGWRADDASSCSPKG